METIQGAGKTVSYMDSGKTMMQFREDMLDLDKYFSRFSSYKGVCVHDYKGFRAFSQRIRKRDRKEKEI